MADLEKKNDAAPEKKDEQKKPAKKNKVKLGERIKKFFRDYKSELKKIVWCPWKQVKNNTVVVIVIVVLTGAAIGVLDFGFGKTITALGGLF